MRIQTLRNKYEKLVDKAYDLGIYVESISLPSNIDSALKKGDAVEAEKLISRFSELLKSTKNKNL